MDDEGWSANIVSNALKECGDGRWVARITRKSAYPPRVSSRTWRTGLSGFLAATATRIPRLENNLAQLALMPGPPPTIRATSVRCSSGTAELASVTFHSPSLENDIAPGRSRGGVGPDLRPTAPSRFMPPVRPFAKQRIAPNFQARDICTQLHFSSGRKFDMTYARGQRSVQQATCC